MDFAELGLILAVASFSFWVKGITGFGGPLLAIPVLAPFIGVEQSVVVISLSNVVSNLMLLWSNRTAGKPLRQLLGRLLVAGAIATVAGTILLTSLNDTFLSIVLAASVIMYISMSLARPELSLTPEQGLSLAIPAGAVGGLMHGALGNSGVVFGSFYHSLKMDRDEFVFALSITFLGFGMLQIMTLAQLGSFGDERLAQATITLVPVVVATRLGEVFGRRLDAAAFGRIVLGLLAVSAVVLIVGVLV